MPRPDEERYVAAFLACDQQTRVRGKLLEAHMDASLIDGAHTTTMTELALAVGYVSYNAGNLQYGLLARTIGEHMGMTPADVEPGGTCWLSFFVDFERPEKNRAGHCVLRLSPVVASAWRRSRALTPTRA